MTIDAMQEFRSTSLEVSEAIAPGWERWRARLEDAVAPVREWMIRELAPQAGQTLLELAAGAGDTGFEAAAMVGEAGLLISTDFSPAMLDVARRRAGELGLGNVQFRVMDAEYLELDADSVDGVLCRFGYMLMADTAAALSETRRVLRSGGRLVLAVWGAPERNPFFTILAAILVQGGHVPPPREGAPNPFSMASPDHAKTLLEAAGFSRISMDEAPVGFRFSDADQYLRFMADTAGPIATALQRLSDQDRKTVAASLDDAFRGFATDNGYALPGVALVAAAS